MEHVERREDETTEPFLHQADRKIKVKIQSNPFFFSSSSIVGSIIAPETRIEDYLLTDK